MTIRSHAGRAAVAGGLALALLGFGAAVAFAEDVPLSGGGAVPLVLDVDDTEGALYLTVDTATPVVLTEGAAIGEHRTFTGVLPTVTVTDTRTDIPDGVAWSVVGAAGDFTHADDPATTISGDRLGWTPRLVGDSVDAFEVAVGGEVESTALDGTGLGWGVDLLVFADESAPAALESTSWEATADLELVVPAAELEAGSYSSTLTLSLFEDELGA